MEVQEGAENMNKVILMGRLTRDPDVRYSGSGDQQQAIARYTIAVDRRMRRDNNDPNAQTADFIGCVAFGKAAQFAENYFHKGIKIAVTGRIQTGSYTNKEGQKIYTTDVVIEDQEFAESKAASQQAMAQASGAQTNQGYVQQQTAQAQTFNTKQDDEGFISIPDGIQEELPFH